MYRGFEIARESLSKVDSNKRECRINIYILNFIQ